MTLAPPRPQRVEQAAPGPHSVLGRVAEPLSTLGAGQGIVVFYGMAKPVRTPLIGPVQP